MYSELIEEREERAKQYNKRTRSQPDWYSRKARTNKYLFQFIGVTIIILGATVGVVPLLFGGTPSVADITVAIIGAFIVMLKGIERIWLPEEKWTNYRKASEALLRENEKYVEGITPYCINDDEDQVYRLYVERCILINAEEQNNFWGINSGRDQKDDQVKKHNPKDESPA